MIAKFDFIPTHCPNCGKKFYFEGWTCDPITGYKIYKNDNDYTAGAGHTCNCGMKFQYDAGLTYHAEW